MHSRGKNIGNGIYSQSHHWCGNEYINYAIFFDQQAPKQFSYLNFIGIHRNSRQNFLITNFCRQDHDSLKLILHTESFIVT